MSLESLMIEDLTQFANEVIRLSGEEALEYYGKCRQDRKFDEELVTEAELHLTEFFNKQLQFRFPQHQLFNNSQENKGYTHEEKRYLWIYDPLDGIANFQAGIPIWGLSLALLENFWPIFGIFYMPATGDLFHAQAGQKAFWGEKEILVSNQRDITNESLILTYSRFHKDYHTTFPGKIRNLGCTSAHICYVAMGCAEATIVANESYQGLAAVRVIIEAAQGKIFKMDGSEFFLNKYLDGQRIDERLIIVPPDIYSQVRNYLKEVF